MDIFADSYAKKHEGFFGWFGHSRVGSGFDAEQFRRNVERHPETFSLSPDYQIIYWAGCNSYSYYTLPFFEMKAALNFEQDPNGTKKLDLISNALPSLFSFNAYNADVFLQALLNWKKPTSYQVLIIVNVLGDEDNENTQ